MIAVKKDSPLIFGFGEGENFIASDVPAILPYTRSVVYLNDGDMVVFTKNAAQFYDANGTPVRKAPEHIEWRCPLRRRAAIRTSCSRKFTTSLRPCAIRSIPVSVTAASCWTM